MSEKRLGEQACALCCVRAGQPLLDLASMKDYLGAVGPSQEYWPEHLPIMRELIYTTTTGKIDKKNLARIAIAELHLG